MNQGQMVPKLSIMYPKGKNEPRSREGEEPRLTLHLLLEGLSSGIAAASWDGQELPTCSSEKPPAALRHSSGAQGKTKSFFFQHKKLMEAPAQRVPTAPAPQDDPWGWRSWPRTPGLTHPSSQENSQEVSHGKSSPQSSFSLGSHCPISPSITSGTRDVQSLGRPHACRAL